MRKNMMSVKLVAAFIALAFLASPGAADAMLWLVGKVGAVVLWLLSTSFSFAVGTIFAVLVIALFVSAMLAARMIVRALWRRGKRRPAQRRGRRMSQQKIAA